MNSTADKTLAEVLAEITMPSAKGVFATIVAGVTSKAALNSAFNRDTIRKTCQYLVNNGFIEEDKCAKTCTNLRYLAQNGALNSANPPPIDRYIDRIDRSEVENSTEDSFSSLNGVEDKIESTDGVRGIILNLSDFLNKLREERHRWVREAFPEPNLYNELVDRAVMLPLTLGIGITADDFKQMIREWKADAAKHKARGKSPIASLAKTLEILYTNAGITWIKPLTDAQYRAVLQRSRPARKQRLAVRLESTPLLFTESELKESLQVPRESPGREEAGRQEADGRRQTAADSSDSCLLTPDSSSAPADSRSVGARGEVCPNSTENTTRSYYAPQSPYNAQQWTIPKAGGAAEHAELVESLRAMGLLGAAKNVGKSATGKRKRNY